MNKELVLDGKTYISARRVSEITGYNSDYLGQLCRADKLDCRLVSRTWYVTEESLKSHYLSNGRKKIKKDFLPDPGSAEFSKNQKFVLTALSKETAQRNASVIGTEPIALRGMLSNFLFAFVVSVSAVLIIIDVNNLFVKSDTNLYGHIKEVAINAKEIIGPTKIIDSAGTSVLSATKQNITNRFSVLKESVKIAISNLLKKRNYLVREEKFRESDVFLPKFGPDDDRGAVMIPVPAETDVSSLSKIKNYLRDSFSDDVEIVPDESGVAGVIKPVFAAPTEDEYFYVMVPVR